ncbi:Annexin A7 [Taenia solium]|eukprot:TsM_000209700 transcript=TsM_000209700 gene=TsM_000209700
MTRGGTVQPASFMNPKADAEAIDKAFKGPGYKKDVLLDIFTNRSTFQRSLILNAYKAGFGESLKQKVKSEINGDFKVCLLSAFDDQSHADARALYKAMSSVNTQSNTLMEVICTSTNQEIRDIKLAYQDEKIRNLEGDLKSCTSGNFQRLLIAVSQGMRSESVDPQIAAMDAKILYDAGEGRMGTDDSTFVRIFATRSWESLQRTDEVYTESFGHGLFEAVEKETRSNFRRGLQLILEAATNRIKCYAKILYDSMKGLGTRDETLIRMIVGHSEVRFPTC